MEQSDEDIYRRHFEMVSERIRVERIKAKAAADAYKANRTQEEIERDERRAKREIEREARITPEEWFLWGDGRIRGRMLLYKLCFVFSVALGAASIGLTIYASEAWKLFGGIALLSFVSGILFFRAWDDAKWDHVIWKENFRKDIKKYRKNQEQAFKDIYG